MMEGWKYVELGNICKIKGGKRLPKGHSLTEKVTSHPYIRARDIKEGKINFDQPVYVEDDTFQKISRYIVNEGQVILTIAGTVAEVALVTNEFDKASLTENAVKIIVDETQISAMFLKFLCQSDHIKSYFELIASGAAQPKLGIYKIQSTKVNLPPIPTQRKIASILSAYDDLIENNLKRIKLLEEKAQLTYEEWFVRLKFPGHETTPINAETGLPEGWEKRPFEDVIDFKEGPGLRNWQYREEGIPFLNIRVIKDGDVDMTKVQFLDPNEVENKYKHFLLEENDHVISSSGTLGRLTTIRKCHLPICLNTSIIRMRSKDEQFGKWLIKHTLLGQIFQSTMEIYANGSAQVNFGPTHLKQIKLPIPSTEIAVKYERIMEPIEEQIKLLRDKNQYLKEARDILLPRLMTGMINVEQMKIETLQPTTA